MYICIKGIKSRLCVFDMDKSLVSFISSQSSGHLGLEVTEAAAAAAISSRATKSVQGTMQFTVLFNNHWLCVVVHTHIYTHTRGV